MSLIWRRHLPPGAWDRFVDAHPDGWFWHRESWLDYCLAYDAQASDRSFANVVGSEIQSIVPLIQRGDEFSLNGLPLPSPLWRGERFDISDLELRLFAEMHGVRRWRMRRQPTPHIPCVRPSWETYVLDVRDDAHLLWRGVRKSYRSLINAAIRERRIETSVDYARVDECRRLHGIVSGRDSRPKTWELWRQWAKDGHLLMALVSRRDDAGRTVSGYAAVFLYKTWAYYASCATEEQNTAHALQWSLITALRAFGVTHYELGWAERPGDTDKDRGISHFKAGWGGALWTIPAEEREF